MKHEVKVVNLKCGGCERSIKDRLGKAGMQDVIVSINNSTVSFEGDKNLAVKILSKMGYPPEDSAQAKSLLKKGISYLSCSIGKLKK